MGKTLFLLHVFNIIMDLLGVFLAEVKGLRIHNNVLACCIIDVVPDVLMEINGNIV